jgi:hypothetical protein
VRKAVPAVTVEASFSSKHPQSSFVAASVLMAGMGQQLVHSRTTPEAAGAAAVVASFFALTMSISVMAW